MSATLENLLISYARWFPIRRGKMRVINSLWQTVTGGKDTQRVATLKYSAFKVPCDLKEMLQRQFYFFGTYFVEEDILSCWTSAAREARMILDVGANAGIYSFAALSSQPNAVVHAFEPTPEIAARLRASVQLNELNQLRVHQLAVFKRTGYATLMRCRGESGCNEGMNFLSADAQESSGSGERVETVSLDEFCARHAIDHVDLLKVDVQGHESSVLWGAERLITAGRIGTIFMELNWSPDRDKPCPASDSVYFLDRAGYRFSRPGKRLQWFKAGEWLRDLGDVVATLHSS
jgi:FkbM family methyltransferase